MKIGPALKTAREKQAISLEVVEQETKIRKKYLIALEEENFDIIPGEVYVRGFLRNYARFLGLDGEYLVDQYNSYARSPFQDSDTSDSSATKDVKKSDFRPKNGKSFNWLALTGLLFLAGVMVLIVGLKIDGDELQVPLARQDEQLSSPRVNTSTSADGLSGHDHLAFANEKDADKHDANAKGINLALTFDGRCWMKVKVDEEEVFEGFAYAGETREFSGREIIAIRMGNAGVVRATVNGEEKGYLGEKGQVVQKVFRLEEQTDA